MTTPESQESDNFVGRNLDPELTQILNETRDVSFKPIWLGVLLVLVVWSMGFVPWFLQFDNWPWELSWGLHKAGEFGDSFGFINSLISSLALVGVIAAIWLQKQELAEQRKELIITQWELRKSAKAQEESKTELANQARINLQSTVLTAFQAMGQSLTDPSIHVYEDDRRLSARFVDQLRQTVIVSVLRNDPKDNFSSEISSKLDLWNDITFVINACHDIATACSSLTRRLSQMQNASDIERVNFMNERLNPVLEMVQRKAGHLDASMHRLSPNHFSVLDWIETARKYGHAELYPQLNNDLEQLIANLKTMLEIAYEARRNLTA